MKRYNKYKSNFYDNYSIDDGWRIVPTQLEDTYILCEVVIQWDCEKLKVYNLIPRENTKVNTKRYNYETN